MGDIADMMFDIGIDAYVDYIDGLLYHRQLIENRQWKTASGKIMYITDMSTNHLLNTIKMLRRALIRQDDVLVHENINMMEEELKRRNKNMGAIQNVDLKVVGVTFNNDDGTKRSDIIKNMDVNTAVTLEREPDNKYDANAIKVMTEYGQIGYIGKDYSAILAGFMDAGRQFIARVKGCGEYNNRPYCEITINEV